jgi:hypothetical protein
MDRVTLENVLAEVSGCTFASLDAVTTVSPGITHEVIGKRVILFTNKKSSGYDNMVRRRLIEAGKDPDSFSLGDLPWGTRVPNSPLIEHKGKGKVYLQVIELAEGISKYFMLGKEANPHDLGIKRKDHYNQGLPPSSQVQVRCYAIENITRIVLMGETLVAEKRNILRIST